MSVENLLSPDRTEGAGGRRLTARIVQFPSIPAVAIVVLIVATALNRFRIDIASLGFRIEHFAFLLVGAVYFVKLIRRQWHPLLARDDVPLALYLAVALIASLLYAPVPKESLQFFGLMAACVLTYILTKSIVADAATFRTAVLALLVVGVGEAVVGIFIWLLYPLGVNLGVGLYPLVFNANRNAVLCTFSPIGTQVESNIFGSYVLPIGLMFTLFLLSAGFSSRRRLMILALVAVLTGVVLSLTRSVWVAFALGTILVLLLADDRRPRSLMNLVPPFLVAVLVGIFASNVQLPCTYVVNEDRTVSTAPGAASAPVGMTTLGKATPTAKTPPQIVPLTTSRITTTATFLERLGTYQGVIEDWLRHPWIGNGANVFGQRHITTAHTPAWISNATLMALHDTGIIGLAILCAWFVWIGRDLVRALRRGPPGFTRTALLALGIAFIGLLVAYQLTTALWLGFTWVYLGLIRAGTLILQRGQTSGLAVNSNPSRQEFPLLATRLENFRGIGREKWLVLVVVSVGLFTAFFRLGAKGLWGDEVWEASWSQQQDFVQTFLRFLGPVDFSLHFLLVKLSTSFSGSEFWVRLPSALLGAASVIIIFFLGRRLFGTRTGVVAALVLAVAPFHVWYAQDARPYASLACYSLLSLYFFCELITAPSRRAWVGFTLANILNLYNAFFALLVLPAELVAAAGVIGWWLLQERLSGARSDRRRQAMHSLIGIIGGAILALLAALPLFPLTAGYVLRHAPGEVRAGAFQLTLPFISSLFSLYGAGPGWALGLLAALFVVGMGIALYRRHWFPFVAIVWLGLPFVMFWVAQPRHIFSPRYFLFLQPVYLLMAAHGLAQIAEGLIRLFSRALSPPSKRQAGIPILVSIVVVGAVTGVMFIPTWNSYWVEKINDWSAICGYLHREVEPGDVITGDAYFIGLMQWCYPTKSGVAILDTQVNPPADLSQKGLNVWYVHIDPSVDMTFVQQGYTAIPRSDWAKPEMTPALTAEGEFDFPRGEHPAAIYFFKAPFVPAQITFHEVHSSDGVTPDYAQIGPRDHLDARLGLAANAPRVLHITMFDLEGRDLNVTINNEMVAEIKAGGSGGKWVTMEFPVPANTPDTFVVDFFNPGLEISAVSAAEAQYAKPSH